MSTAQLVRDHIQQAPIRSFIDPTNLPGSRRAIECELSRLTTKGEIARVRRGLYWKGPKTRIGMPMPSTIETGLAITGIGAGPAAISAQAHLGLTTQLPATETIAVPGRPPAPIGGLRFLSRSIERRILKLNPTEIAVLELLRDGPTTVEAKWDKFATTVKQLETDHLIRPTLIQEQLHNEHHIAARQRWAEIQ